MSVGLEFVWREFHQAALDFVGIVPGCQVRAIGYAKDVRIHGNGRFTEYRVQNHVRRLSSDTRKCFKRLSIAWNFATVLFHQSLRQANYIARLGSIKAG